MRFSNPRARFLLTLLGLSMASVGHGQEPAPWNDLLKSELVVVGRYKSHKNGLLSLEVVDVLRGKTCKAGDVLAVKQSQQIGFKFQALQDEKTNPHYVERFVAANDKLHFPKMVFIDEVDKQVHESLITFN